MFCKLHKPFVNIALLSMIVLGLSVMHRVVTSASPSTPQSQCELVVLSNPDDPYYPLAIEIAVFENTPILHSLPEAMDCHPIFLLWVVSPAFLSDAIMIEFGQTMKEQPTAVSSGIITASTLERARDLWERRAQVRGQRFFAANAPNPSALINQGQIIAFDQGGTTTHPLTKTSFRNILLEADYLTFTGHGGSTFLRLDENTTITPVDIPSLNSVVISTGSCQTFRLWDEDSIARRFVDQGAAAYSGFVFSPNEGYLIGEFNGLPLRYTWGDFPIGHVIQAQNRGTLQGFAQFHYQFLLGDPRIALQTNPPYQLVDDRQEDGRRILTFRNVPQGVIPFRISGGAVYRFVEVPGVTAADKRDPFYNSRLQMVNIQNDKFILLVHGGGELTLRLRSQAPWYWFPGDILLDSLDHTLIFSQQSGGGFGLGGLAAIQEAAHSPEFAPRRTHRDWRDHPPGIIRSPTVGSSHHHLKSGRVHPSQHCCCVCVEYVWGVDLLPNQFSDWQSGRASGHHIHQLDANGFWAAISCGVQYVCFHS
jgi:hypothetical protein